MNTAQQCQLPQSLDRHEGKVYFMHIRAWGVPPSRAKRPEPKGGYTVAYRLLPDGSVEYAAAKCRLTIDRHGNIVNKKSDNFCRRTGREVAKAKLLSNGSVSKVSTCPLRVLNAPHKEANAAIKAALLPGCRIEDRYYFA